MAETIVLYDGPIVSRKEAIEAGAKRYFTGKPCQHGHVAERQTRGTACVECVRLNVKRSPYDKVMAWRDNNPGARTEEARRYRAKYPDRQLVISKRWLSKPENLEKARAYGREYQKKRRSDLEGNRRRIKEFKQRKELGLARIAGRPRPSTCEVCRERRKIVFDHCHDGGGWICDRCNKLLGLAKDDASLLRALAKYLEKDRGRTVSKAKTEPPQKQLCSSW